MELMRWSPLNEIERLIDDVPSTLLPRVAWDLAVDVYEKDDALVAEMQLPGIDPSKVDVSVEHGVLNVSGKREEVREEEGRQYTRKEISRGSFCRRVRLPAAVDEKHARATFHAGVLTVTVPKLAKKEAERHRIPVQAA